MKYILSILIALCYVSAFAQCTECTSFEEALKNPEKVQTLSINSLVNDITLESVPASIGKFVNAEIIYLTDHTFTSVPKEIGNLTKLKELSLSGSPITSLPDEIFQLKNLKELILLNCDFSEAYKAEFKKRAEKELPSTDLMLN
jgi:Leucine-rich repeat (LRR) protein